MAKFHYFFGRKSKEYFNIQKKCFFYLKQIIKIILESPAKLQNKILNYTNYVAQQHEKHNQIK